MAMPSIMNCKWIVPFAVLLSIPSIGWCADSAAREQAERQVTQPFNNAPLWREVRKGENPDQTTQVRGVESNILIQSRGETWRELRPPLVLTGGLIVAATLLVLFGYYRWRGPISLSAKPTGRFIRRFSDPDRFAHWSMGISFAVLAATGLAMTFGKYLLLPVLGYTLFSWVAAIAKTTHNFVAPVFLLTLPLFIVLYMRDNLPRVHDLGWLLKFGGMLSKGSAHIPSGRFNAGEKSLFWALVCFLCVLLCASGVVMLFPNFGQGRAAMQSANIVHLTGALLAIAMSCFHVYLGTVGVRGAYEAMLTGYVDETWAKEHHEIWYEEVKASRARQPLVDSVPAEVRQEIARAIGT